MNDKDLYRQKYQAQLDEWKAEIDKLKARAKGAQADAQLDLNRRIAELEDLARAAGDKLTELSHSSQEALASVKKGVESAWSTLKQSLHEAADKFRDH